MASHTPPHCSHPPLVLMAPLSVEQQKYFSLFHTPPQVKHKVSLIEPVSPDKSAGHGVQIPLSEYSPAAHPPLHCPLRHVRPQAIQAPSVVIGSVSQFHEQFVASSPILKVPDGHFIQLLSYSTRRYRCPGHNVEHLYSSVVDTIYEFSETCGCVEANVTGAL